MQSAIANIINNIPQGKVFDSHFVISRLVKEESDLYIHFAGPAETTNQMHGRLAQLIEKSGLVVKLEPPSWSDTIHGTPDKCTLWQKI